MNIEEFVICVLESVEDNIADDYNVSNNCFIKTNDTVHNAITVQKRGDVIAKNIYLDGYYKLYKQGYSFNSVVDNVLSEIKSENDYRLDDSSEDLLKNIFDYEAVNGKIVLKLLNKDMNKKYLEDKLYIPYMDFAVVFSIIRNDTNNDMATSSIRKELFERWNVSADEIFKQALANSEKILPARIENIGSVITKLLANVEDMEVDDVADVENENLYVLSNVMKLNGAATILYKDILKEFADEKRVDEIIILPSSLHEVLLVPRLTEDMDLLQKCYEMVGEINKTEVDEKEVLSNNIYIYNRNADKIILWNNERN